MTTKTKTRTVDTRLTEWPKRPPGEVFPELLTTLDVAQLLRFDRPGTTPANGMRTVRLLIRDKGLPTLGMLGNGHRFRRDDVLAWAQRRNGDGAKKE